MPLPLLHHIGEGVEFFIEGKRLAVLKVTKIIKIPHNNGRFERAAVINFTADENGEIVTRNYTLNGSDQRVLPDLRIHVEQAKSKGEGTARLYYAAPAYLDIKRV